MKQLAFGNIPTKANMADGDGGGGGGGLVGVDDGQVKYTGSEM